MHSHPTAAGPPRGERGTGVAPGLSAPAPPPRPSALSSLTVPGESQQLSFFLNLFRTPPFLLPIYLAAAERYGVPWQVLAAINEVESDYGYDLGRSSAGAEGWMQFMPEEWLAYGVDANGNGVRDPYNPADAIFAAARYLAAADAAHNLRTAIYAYNHSSSYVESVMLRARLLAATPQPLIGGLAAIVAGRFPVEGGGPHTTTAVWTRSPRLGNQSAGSSSAAPRPTTSPSAPPPQLAATAGTPASTVGGVAIAAAGGARVVAVQNAQVVRTGHSARLGHFIELRDAYGDLYTYAQLDGVLKRYVAPRGSGSTPSERAGRAQAPRSAPAALRAGVWIASGTPIGIVSDSALGGQSQFLFEIHPAGAGAIDPRPVLQAWQLLDETQGSTKAGTTPLFGPGAAEALIQEIQLIGAPQLENDLLSDPRARISACGREDVAAGRVDRRVLAALYFLVASGLDPTVSELRCGHGSEAQAASVREHAAGDAVTISALNGSRIGEGSTAELAARRLLTLPGTMAPSQILGPLRLPSSAATAIRRGAADRLDIGFSAAVQKGATAAAAQPANATTHAVPAPPSPRSLPQLSGPGTGVTGRAPALPDLSTAEWRKLIAHIAQLAQPHLAKTPTSAAVVDTPASPLPRSEPLSGSLPLAPDSGAHAGAIVDARHDDPASPPVDAGGSGISLKAPLSSSLSSRLASGPQVVLETPGVEGVLAEPGHPNFTLAANVIGLSIATYEFQYERDEGDTSPKTNGCRCRRPARRASKSTPKQCPSSTASTTCA